LFLYSSSRRKGNVGFYLSNSLVRLAKWPALTFRTAEELNEEAEILSSDARAACPFILRNGQWL